MPKVPKQSFTLFLREKFALHYSINIFNFLPEEGESPKGIGGYSMGKQRWYIV